MKKIKTFGSILSIFIVASGCFTLTGCKSDTPKASISEFVLNTDNVKKEFNYDEEFTSEGLTAYKMMSDGKKIDLTSNDFSIDYSAFKKGVAGIYTINIHLNDTDFTSFYNVRVNPIPVPKVVGMELDTTNVKKRYFLNDTFDSSNLVVKKVMDTGDKIVVSSDDYLIDFSTFDKTREGSYTIKVTLNGTDFNKVYVVSVEKKTLKVIGIKIDTSNVKKFYQFNEDLDLNGLIVKKVLEDNSEVIINKDEYLVDSSKFNKTTPGDYLIDVSLKNEGYKTNFKVNVSPKKIEIIGITLNCDKVKTTYEYGQDFASEGLIVIKNMDNGSEFVADSNEYSVDTTNFDKTTPGTYTIKVTLNGTKFTKEFTVTVNPKPVVVESISLDLTNVKQEFEFNEEFTSEGLIVHKHMSDGSNLVAYSDEYLIDSSLFIKNQEGSYTITVNLIGFDFSDTYIVKVKPFVVKTIDIELNVDGVKKIYDYNQELDLNGLIVKKVLNNGDKIIVNEEEYTIDSSKFDKLSPGVHVIKVTLNGTKIFKEFTVTVNPKPVVLESISLDLTNVKKEFAWNENFTSEGLIVYKHMSDGSKVVASRDEYNLNYNNFKNDLPGRYEIIINLKNYDLKTSYIVRVKEIGIRSIRAVILNNLELNVVLINGDLFESWKDSYLEIIYENNVSETLKITKDMIGEAELSTTGIKSVDITYKNLIDTVEFKVVDRIVKDQTFNGVYEVFNDNEVVYFEKCRFNYGLRSTKKNMDLIFISCVFNNINDISDIQRDIYLTSFKNLAIDSCEFLSTNSQVNVAKSVIGIDLNIYNMNVEDIFILDSRFNISSTNKNTDLVSISISTRLGKDDIVNDSWADNAVEGKILNPVIISGNTFIDKYDESNNGEPYDTNNNYITIGINGKEKNKLSTGSFDVDFVKTKTEIEVYEKYLYTEAEEKEMKSNSIFVYGDKNIRVGNKKEKLRNSIEFSNDNKVATAYFYNFGNFNSCDVVTCKPVKIFAKEKGTNTPLDLTNFKLNGKPISYIKDKDNPFIYVFDISVELYQLSKISMDINPSNGKIYEFTLILPKLEEKPIIAELDLTKK